MGIKNLNNLLRKKCPEIFELIHISEYAYKKVAIDISVFVNKYKRSVGDRWLAQVLNLVSCLRRNNLHCVFIYDGGAPPEKDNERSKRKAAQEKIEHRTAELQEALDHYYNTEEILPILVEFHKRINSHSPKRLLPRKGESIDMSLVARKIEKRNTYTENPTKHDFELTKQLLTILNVPWFIAPLEAETICSDLCKRGLVDAVVSEDTDIIAYGTPIFLTNINTSDCTSVRVKYSDVLNGVDLTSDSFLDLCIMCGTDYNNNIEGIGSVKAHKLIKQHETIEAVGINTDLDISILNHCRGRELFKNYDQINPVIKFCGLPNYEKLQAFIFKHNMRIDVNGIKSSFEDNSDIIFKE